MSEDIVKKLRQNENIPVANLPKDYFVKTANLYFDLGLVGKKVDATSFGYAN